MAILLNGLALATKIRGDIKEEISSKILSKNLRAPTLSVVLVGDDMASKVYVAGKVKACDEAGIKCEVYKLEENTNQRELNNLITKLNKSKEVDGILLQLPLPPKLNTSKALNLINPKKDVDGLTNLNLGKLLVGDPSGFVPCTAMGILKLIQANNIDLTGKNVAIIGRSLLVGKPTAQLFTKENATVTLCHTKTVNLPHITKHSDIIVSAVGKANFIKSSMVKQGVVIVDVGINRDKNGKVCGDVNFKSVSKIASFITPVPGGVGPMTIAMLLNNVLSSYKKTKKLK